MSGEPPLDERAAGELRLDAAIASLQSAIKARVRTEQQVDQLTGLANDTALTAWLDEKVADGSDFWIAFVEVDHFKRKNEEFGYKNADELLKRIATQLKNACTAFLPGNAVPVRAHGDEFYLAGQLEGAVDRVAEAVEHVRRSIELLEIPQLENLPMKCTVSVGWLTSLDSRGSEDLLSERGVRTQLELAVAEAKRERNRVVRYSTTMVRGATKDGRADCSSCDAKFSVTVHVTKLRTDQLHCPNCGGLVDRPSGLTPEALGGASDA